MHAAVGYKLRNEANRESSGHWQLIPDILRQKRQ